MAIFGLGVRTLDGTIGTAAWEIATSQNLRARVLEVGFSLVAATASTFGIGRPAAIGITPTTPEYVVSCEPSPVVGHVRTAVAWETGPTAPASAIRRVTLPATVGANVVWRFDRLSIGAGSSLVLWNYAGNSVVDAYVVVEDAGEGVTVT